MLVRNGLGLSEFYLFTNSTEIVKHAQTTGGKPMNWLSLFNHFAGFALKDLTRTELNFREVFKIVAL